MVTEEKDQTDLQSHSLFLNHFVVDSPSHYYGGANFSTVKIQKFDPKTIASTSFDNHTGPKLVFDPSQRVSPIKNFCADSNFIGFGTQNELLSINNGETGDAIDFDAKGSGSAHQLYDHYLAYIFGGVAYPFFYVVVVDLLTKKQFRSKKFTVKVTLGFMTSTTIALHAQSTVVLWNFIDNTEIVYPAGQMPKRSIALVYNDMWLVYREAKLAFYDPKDGSWINTLALRQCSSENISLLSDGRLGVVQRTGCRVISFVDSEVNRKIKVHVIAATEALTIREISAYQLAEFFVKQTKKDYEAMTSRIISYSAPSESDEQFVMIFGAQEGPGIWLVNEKATEWLNTAVQPSCLNTPYQGWKFDDRSITAENIVVSKVYGTVIIVREKKIDGRWQLVSM